MLILVRNSLIRCMVAAFILALVSTSSILGQRWQVTSGEPLCEDIARKGVTAVSLGGCAIVGESFTSASSCSSSDIYVAKFTTAATLDWGYTYDIGGGNDYGTCIRECPNGDFIVVGFTEDPIESGGCNFNDVFLMRLNSSGGVLWARTYGTPGIEVGTSIIVMETGDRITTNAGDFAVCGWTVNDSGNTVPFLMRTTSTGDLVWDKFYHFGGTLVNGQFADLVESLASPCAGDTGTIVVAGFGDFIADGLQLRAAMARFDGNTGDFIALDTLYPLSAIIAPDNIDAEGISQFYAIDELRIGGYAGDLVATGYYQRLSSDLRDTNSQDVFVARFSPRLSFIIDTISMDTLKWNIYGDMVGFDSDVGYDILEQRINGGGYGYLALTGRMTVPDGLGREDMFFIQVDPGTLLYALATTPLFGSEGNDVGLSIAEVKHIPFQQSQGFVLAGYTESTMLMPVGDKRQAYVVKTDSLITYTCYQSGASLDYTPLNLGVKVWYDGNPVIAALWTDTCSVGVTRTSEDGLEILCYIPIVSGMTHEEEFSTADGLKESGLNLIDVLQSNPVKRGSNAMLRLGQAGNRNITITDITGKIVYRMRQSVAVGGITIQLPTSALAAGNYLVSIGHDEKVEKSIVLVIND